METYNFTEMKALGDQCFKNKDYQGAVENYLEIIKNEDSPGANIYQNISLCYKKLGDWEKVEKYSNEALMLDDKYIKCLKLRGEAKIELHKFKEEDEAMKGIDEGIEDIKKAHRLTHGQDKTGFNRDIEHALRIAKKIKYYKEKEINKKLKNDLFSYLKSPIEEHTADSSESDRLKAELQDLLKDPSVEEQKIPEFLTCPISLEVMIDPKILSSGHTYEKEEIIKHIKKNGYRDPLTNELLQDVQFDNMPGNINLRQAIEDYLEKNPWAYKHHKDEDYSNISFDM
ncbi:unnamed protein product [Moneuplotes crassus]|uniref:RING-type E3 ubiquitin transferase n=1 Tax=Euplotes crassus TaxID=5936 RepID=A0AAD1UE19_EUPCR|nr:unnamed protein product [Moneuplotes crassus]